MFLAWCTRRVITPSALKLATSLPRIRAASANRDPLGSIRASEGRQEVDQHRAPVRPLRPDHRYVPEQCGNDTRFAGSSLVPNDDVVVVDAVVVVVFGVEEVVEE
eukprot:PhM_4_TR2388/c2_g1_i3/m.10375